MLLNWSATCFVLFDNHHLELSSLPNHNFLTFEYYFCRPVVRVFCSIRLNTTASGLPLKRQCMELLVRYCQLLNYGLAVTKLSLHTSRGSDILIRTCFLRTSVFTVRQPWYRCCARSANSTSWRADREKKCLHLRRQVLKVITKGWRHRARPDPAAQGAAGALISLERGMLLFAWRGWEGKRVFLWSDFGYPKGALN